MDKINIPQTLEEDLGFWKKQGQRKVVRFLIWTVQNKRCIFCKWTMEGGLLNKYPKQVVDIAKLIKGEYIFHIKSTHGFEPEIFLEMLNG